MIVIDEIEYEARPVSVSGDCRGCAGRRSASLCVQLPACNVPEDVIFVQVETPKQTYNRVMQGTTHD